MHILYIHQHFALPCGSTGTRSYEFARRWVAAGHRVTVITGHYDIGGLEYTSKPFVIDGIEIRIVGAKYSNKQSFFRRILSFVSFMLLSIWVGLRVQKPDIVYATSTPLTVGVTAVFLKWLRGVKFVFEVRDQWPRVPIELGIIKNPVVKLITSWLEKFIYMRSDAVVALSPGMAEGVNEVTGGRRQVVVAPNCCDLDRFNPAVDGSDIRKSRGWEGKFIVIHFGSMGKANGLDFLVQAADKLRSEKDIHFVVVGDGATKHALVEQAGRLALTNIEFTGNIPKNKLPEYVAACDVSTVIFTANPILEHNSANKFFDSVSAGKPILLNYSGWQRDVLEQYNAGLGCIQGDIDDYLKKIIYLKNNPAILHFMAVNSRRLACEQFSRDVVAKRVLETLLIKGRL